ncbi:MAG: SufE family protein, partial [Akkermansiaceae bacterium]|nr:SufE family protein [Akkermansiaceae bacterium]
MTADFKDSFEERRRVLLQELESLPGEGALYGFLIRQGNVLVPLAEEWKTDAQLLQGCQYRVWLHSELEDGLVQVHADSDSLISRGLVALWVRLFSGLIPEEVLAADESFLHQSVLSSWLVPSRSNALGNMASRIKLGVLKLRKGAWGG